MDPKNLVAQKNKQQFVSNNTKVAFSDTASIIAKSQHIEAHKFKDIDFLEIPNPSLRKQALTILEDLIRKKYNQLTPEVIQDTIVLIERRIRIFNPDMRDGYRSNFSLICKSVRVIQIHTYGKISLNSFL